jgi:hypothetical protein
MKKVIFIYLIFKTTFIFGQASWNSKFCFNLFLDRKEINKKDFNQGKFKLFTNDLEHSVIFKYDSIYNSFTYTSNSITEFRSFYICTKYDTLKIEFSGLNKVIVLKQKIEMNETKSYSLFSNQITKFISNNKSCNVSKDGWEIFYFDLPKKEKLVINKDEFKYLKEIEIQEEE